MKKIFYLFLLLPFLFSFTRQDTYNLLLKYEVKEPKIVLAQAILETNCGKTGVGVTHNNLFGFRTKNGYIRFETFESCIRYYKKWQDKYYKGQDYYTFLTCLYKTKTGKCIGYNPNYTYIVKLKKIENSIKL